jgi:hypothetical protein
MSISAMKQALEALDLIDKDIAWQYKSPTRKFCNQAAHFLRQAIEQAEKQEGWVLREVYFSEGEPICHREPQPVAWWDPKLGVFDEKHFDQLQPLFTAPSKKEWIGLTADEIWKCNKAEAGSAVEFHICSAHQNVLDFAEAIEARLKRKNAND